MIPFRRSGGRVEAQFWHEPGDHPAVVRLADGRTVLPTPQGVWYINPGDWIVQNGPLTQVYPPDAFAALFQPTRKSKNILPCEFCQKEFRKKHPRQIYCSRDCFRAARQKERNRRYSDEELLATHRDHLSLRNTADVLGVSQESVRQRLKKLGIQSDGPRTHHQTKRVAVTCKGCGLVFTVPPSGVRETRFHNRECFQNWRREQNKIPERKKEAYEMLKNGRTILETSIAVQSDPVTISRYIRAWKAEGIYPPTTMKPQERRAWFARHETPEGKSP